MHTMRWVSVATAAALACAPLLAAEVTFSGGANGVDPLGNAWSFDGTTFRLASGTDGFNPRHEPIGSGTSAASFRLGLDGPGVFNPTPVDLPNACPAGQTAVYISLNPLTIICVGMTGGGPIIRHTWTWLSVAQPGTGTGTFNAPDGQELLAGKTPFEVTLTFQKPIDPASFSFTAAWSDLRAPVPEPSAAWLSLGGLAMLSGVAVRRRRVSLGADRRSMAPS